MKRSALLALVLALMCLMLPAMAEDWSDYYAFTSETAVGYETALETYAGYSYAREGTRVELLPGEAVLSGDAVLSAQTAGAAEVLVLGDGDGTATWTVDVPVTGLYELEISYYNEGGNEAKIQRRLTIDGTVP